MTVAATLASMTHRWEAALCAALATHACGPMPLTPCAAAPSATEPTSTEAPPAPIPPESLWPGAAQQPLGEARIPFAHYLNLVHTRVHPFFADGFLASLDALPASDPRNAPGLATMLAFVIDGRTGGLDSVEVTRTSGVPGFDSGALDSMKRAFPTSPPAPATWSSNGKVHVHWEFHRGPEACGTWNARPFKLTFRALQSGQ
jgi:hypothetical protein